tara:strand:+ start:3282 stop:3836 length:555 start_codon:yes stop_codon:yes gene_type:complete
MSTPKRTSVQIKPISAVYMVFAGIVYAIALKYFVFPSGIILTGTEGIAVSISYYFEKTSIFILLYALFQITLITFAYKKISRGFAIRSAIVVSTVVLLLLVMPEMSFADPEPQNERITLVLFGGIIAGFAKAIAFKNRGSPPTTRSSTCALWVRSPSSPGWSRRLSACCCSTSRSQIFRPSSIR